MKLVKPIRTNAQHAAALREVDALLGSHPRPNGDQADRLEVLTILIEAFERDHPEHRIDAKADPVEAITFHLQRVGKDAKDLELILGASRTRVWEILNRRRALTLVQIRALVRQLGIPADRLIAEYPTHSASRSGPTRTSLRRPPAKTKRAS